MGSAVGACAAAAPSVARVLWADDGRSAASRACAEADGMVDAGSLAALAAQVLPRPTGRALALPRTMSMHILGLVYKFWTRLMPTASDA